ncbi:MAG: MmoB/DmpM family protein [Actinomycetota bacterium]
MGGNELDQVVANNDIGMSLVAGEEADAIVELLKEELGDRLRVTDCMTYLKLETDVGKLEVRFADVADILGRRFNMHDFQVIFSSYYGRPHLLDDRMGIYESMTAGVREGDLVAEG